MSEAGAGSSLLRWKTPVLGVRFPISKSVGKGNPLE